MWWAGNDACGSRLSRYVEDPARVAAAGNEDCLRHTATLGLGDF